MEKEEITINQLSYKIAYFIIKSKCFSLKNEWIDLDHLWHETEKLEAFSILLCDYLVLLKKNLFFNKIILANKLFGPFGPIPLFIMATQKMDPKIPFIIWKEWARPLTGEGKIFGGNNIEQSDRLLICHDVIDHGATVVKLFYDLKKMIEKQPGAQIVGIISICTTQRNGEEFIKNQTLLEPKYIVSLDNLLSIERSKKR